jgi:hypothetical protein
LREIADFLDSQHMSGIAIIRSGAHLSNPLLPEVVGPSSLDRQEL